MRLGIMQPYFFPYLGHFSLISRTDRWVVLDLTQYTPQSWMNRNRVLRREGGWCYLTLPLANSSSSIRISEARILDAPEARRKIMGKLAPYRRQAPFFAAVAALFDQVFGEASDDSLVHLNIRALRAVCGYLGLAFDCVIASELDLGLPGALGAGDWALEISARLGATEYLNPIGGQHLFDPTAWRERGISLRFLAPKTFVYDTGPFSYEPDLSILDVLMWNSPQKVLEAARSHSAVLPAVH